MKIKQSPGRHYDVAAKYLSGTAAWEAMNGQGLPIQYNTREGIKKALKDCGNSRRFIAAIMRRFDRGQIV